MYRENRCRPRSDLFAHLFRIDAKGICIAVGKCRRKSVPDHRVRSGMKRKTWQDNVTTQIQRLQNQKKSGRAAGHSYTVFYAQIDGRGFFKLSDVTSRSKLLAAKNSLHVPEKFCHWRQFRHHHRQHRLERWARNSSGSRFFVIGDRNHLYVASLLACSPITFAGTPQTVVPSGTSWRTTAPAP